MSVAGTKRQTRMTMGAFGGAAEIREAGHETPTGHRTPITPGRDWTQKMDGRVVNVGNPT